MVIDDRRAKPKLVKFIDLSLGDIYHHEREPDALRPSLDLYRSVVLVHTTLILED